MLQSTFLSKAQQKHNGLYSYPFLTKVINSKDKVSVVCSKHGEFHQLVNNHLHGSGCLKCSREKDRKPITLLLLDFERTHGLKYNYSLVRYVNSQTKVKIICSEHGVFEQTPVNHIKGRGCLQCALKSRIQHNKLRAKTLTGFIKRAKKVHSHYDYSKAVYIKSGVKIEIICTAHGSFWQRPFAHLRGSGCPKCSGRYTKTNDEFLAECKRIHNNYYDYSKTYYENNKSKIIITCPKHGDFSQKAAYHLCGKSGCPKCRQSKGEVIIRMFLEKENIDFEIEKTFDGFCGKAGKSFKFDFYLPDYNTCIEFDGIQHFKSVKYFGGEGALTKSKLADQIKNDFCQKNKIRIIRIKYDENILETLTQLFSICIAPSEQSRKATSSIPLALKEFNTGINKHTTTTENSLITL